MSGSPTSANEQRAASQARAAGLGFTLPAVAWIVLFFGAPLIIMAGYSLLPLTSDGTPPHFSFSFMEPVGVKTLRKVEVRLPDRARLCGVGNAEYFV